MNPAHRININQTATDAVACLAAAESSGDARSIKAAEISLARLKEWEAIAASKKAWAFYRFLEAAAELAYQNGSQDLEGGGDCWAVIKAEGAEAAAHLADEEVSKAKEYRAAIEKKYNL